MNNDDDYNIYSPEKTPEHSGLIGFFSKKIYISYLIQTEPAKLRVRRRYTDFEWFRNTLTKLYQGIYVSIYIIKYRYLQYLSKH
jgi:hypothetical protein